MLEYKSEESASKMKRSNRMILGGDAKRLAAMAQP
jgi:hypothetical protein